MSVFTRLFSEEFDWSKGTSYYYATVPIRDPFWQATENVSWRINGRSGISHSIGHASTCVPSDTERLKEILQPADKVRKVAKRLSCTTDIISFADKSQMNTGHQYASHGSHTTQSSCSTFLTTPPDLTLFFPRRRLSAPCVLVSISDDA
jgi:hypothetical protein